MFKFSLSVRAYNEGRKFGLPRFEDWHRTPDSVMRLACKEAAIRVLAHHRGKKTAVELFRASGMGVYNIAMLMTGEGLDYDRIIELCEKYDQDLHQWGRE